MTHRQVPLSRGKFSLVDEEDYERVMRHKWWILDAPTCETDYAVTETRGPEGRKVLRMHRFILGLTDPCDETDHINRNGLDNRKNNLRIADRRTQALNSRLFATNTSGYRGVCRSRNGKRWRAYHFVNNKQAHIGIYDTPEEASHAREEFVRSFA